MADTPDAPAPAPAVAPVVDAAPMPISFMLSEVRSRIHMFSTNTDMDSTLRKAALKNVSDYCMAESARLDADLANAATAAVGA